MRYCSAHCRVTAHEQRKADRLRERGIVQKVRLNRAKRLTPQARWRLHLIERPDDQSKPTYQRSQIPALVLPLTDQLQDAIARLYEYVRGDPTRLVATSDRPLSCNKEAVAATSEYERVLHDLLLWAARIVIEAPLRGRYKAWMRGHARTHGRNRLFRKKASR